MISSHLFRFFFFFGYLLLPAQAVKVRIATYNVLTGIGPTGDSSRQALEAVLSRIDADVLGLQEVTSGDIGTNLPSLAANLGYPHVFIPTTALDTSSRVILLSKYPFAPNSTESIVSPNGANDVTRAAAAADIDVPGTTNDPVVITAHLKCCFDQDDPFRRAVEMIRIRKYLEGKGYNGSDNIFVLGDFNLLGSDQTFSSKPSGLPASFVLGNDITFNVDYFSDPTSYFTGQSLVDPGYRQQNGFTTDTFMGSSVVLDHLLVSQAVANRNFATEIYNSSLETSFPGIPKSGPPLSSSTSGNASDHYPVFGDFEMDGDSNILLTVTPDILGEDSPPATVTVTLSTPQPDQVIITLQADDPSEASLAQTELVIPAGNTSASTTLVPKLDKISDGNQTLGVQVTASGYQGSLKTVTIQDTDPLSYVFRNSTDSIIEDFSGFDGSQSLSTWSDGGVIWRGFDDGSLSIFGARSYQESLGILTSGEVAFRTRLRNDSSTSIQALAISCDARLWRRSAAGSPDRLEMSFLRNGVETAIPDLTFQPPTNGESGIVDPPDTLPKNAYLRGLNLEPGEEIQLVVRAIPGQPTGSTSGEVFINEFHYDNAGTDEGEFIEVVVGNEFAGELSKTAIHLYNGNNGQPYGSVHPLNTFAVRPNTPPGSPLILFKMIPGIQNGGPDGIVLATGGTVREFLSYEGSFTASSGIAMGLTSTNVGITQGSGTPVGQNSIARTGTGGSGSDFVWQNQPGPHTPGEMNLGQDFGASPRPQGMAIDNLVISPLSDSDGDLLPDQEELALGTDPNDPDSDQDGLDDYFEVILTGTNPRSVESYFSPTIIPGASLTEITFPSLKDRVYQVEFSENLEEWTPTPARMGTGNEIAVSIPLLSRAFVRVWVSIP